MNWYKKHIGDYHKKAGKLSMLQHGAYMLLIDSCYDRERFPTMEEAIEWCWASTDDEIRAVKFVINRFFIPETATENCVYFNPRIKEEIQHYLGLCLSNEINGKKGGRPKKKTEPKPKETEPVNLKTESVKNKSESKANESESNPNQEPRTKNQEPLNNKTLGHSQDQSQNDFLFDKFWNAGMRKAGDKPKTKSKFIKILKSPRKKTLHSTSDDYYCFTEFLVNDIKSRINSNQLGFDQMLPSTYLNQQRWNDEIKQNKPSNGISHPDHRDTLLKRLKDRSWAVGMVDGLDREEIIIDQVDTDSSIPLLAQDGTKFEN